MKRHLSKKAMRTIMLLAIALMLVIQGLVLPLRIDAASNVQIEINGFQISTGLEAFRTVYSVVDTAGQTSEIGLVYGLTDYVTGDDMVVGSTNSTVYSYAATSEGTASVNYSNHEDAVCYVRTMSFIKKAEFYNMGISVRAYAKLNDGTYVYSDVSKMTVYKVADLLYKGCRMGNAAGHEYLYNNILTVVDPSYKTVDYNWGNVIVPVESMTAIEEPTAEETTTVEETTTEQETTTVVEETTTARTVNSPGIQTEAADSEVASNISLVSYISEIDTDFSSTTGNTSGNEGIDKLFDNDINTKFYAGVYPPYSIAWKMKRAVVIKTYTLVTANDAANNSHRNPHKWRLFGSANGRDWIQLDYVEDGGIEAKNFTSYTYETDVQEACQFFMLRIEDSGENGVLYYGSQLAEIYLNGDIVQLSTDIGVELDEQIKEINTSATTVEGYNSNEGVENLFDGDTSTKLYTNTSTPCSIAWTMNKETSIYSYTLTTANDNATFKNRTIKSWVLYGSNDGNSWDAIDTVTDSGMDDINYADYTYIVDKVGAYTQFKLTVTEGYGDSFQLSEISLNGCASFLENEYEVLFIGDWDQITAPNYKKRLKALFDEVYPRLYARWGGDTDQTPKIVYVTVDTSTDSAAYSYADMVAISANYVNSNPVSIGYFSHELTHVVQQYYVDSSGPDWWVENMANYGGFRYYHWATEDNVQVHLASEPSLQDWGYEPYGDNAWFFAYMDAKYPTTKSSDGTVTLGLIDSINSMLKVDLDVIYDDNPYDTTTPWNKLVKQITGYDCIDALRLKFAEELQNGTWEFKGYRDYADNWITEGLPGVDDPTYPMVGEKTHGNTVATKLATPVTSGTNLCNGATILHTTGQYKISEAAEMLIDGNLDTKWCSKSSTLTTFNGRVHSVKIDLGSIKTFNTYTLYNTRTKESTPPNMSEWEILVSEDGKTWKSVDYQVNNDNNISSYNIGTQTARYVQIKVFNPGDSAGTVRLYEFQLYNQ